jgi:hypothetical protein
MGMKYLHEKTANRQPVVTVQGPGRPNRRKAMSNLSVLMNQHQASVGIPVEIQVSAERGLDEADSASGPPVRHLVSSAPNLFPPSGVLHRGGPATSVRAALPSLASILIWYC